MTTTAERAEQIRLETYGKVFTCSRCRSRVDGIHGDDHEAILLVLGWHRAGTIRFCSKTCLQWHEALAARGEAPVAVEQLQDRAYQLRRAQLGNLPASAPPLPIAKPVRR